MLTENQEVNDINKQKFLAELGRLLAFMYDEDRKMALAMYSDMFDSCRDEELLVQSLGSPTRQAVAVARNYDAKSRKQQLASEDGANASGEVPEFISTIGMIKDAVLEGNRAAAPVDENQFSLFRDDDQPHIDFTQPVSEPVPEVSAAPFVEEFVPEMPAEDIPEAEEPIAEPEPVAAAAATAAAVSYSSDISVDDLLNEMLNGTSTEPAPAAEPVPAPDAGYEDVAPKSEGDPSADVQDSVDRFISDFSFDNGLAEAQTEQPVPEAEAEDLIPETAEAADGDVSGAGEEYPSLYSEDDFYNEPVVKADVLLLILYIIAAIPLSLIGIAVLLALTVVVLALAAASIVGGLFVFSAGLRHLTMIADIMVVIGCGLALFALGLLFLWTAVWLVCGAIVGLVRGVFALARKWCYKEVEQ